MEDTLNGCHSSIKSTPFVNTMPSNNGIHLDAVGSGGYVGGAESVHESQATGYLGQTGPTTTGYARESR